MVLTWQHTTTESSLVNTSSCHVLPTALQYISTASVVIQAIIVCMDDFNESVCSATLVHFTFCLFLRAGNGRYSHCNIETLGFNASPFGNFLLLRLSSCFKSQQADCYHFQVSIYQTGKILHISQTQITITCSVNSNLKVQLLSFFLSQLSQPHTWKLNTK